MIDYCPKLIHFKYQKKNIKKSIFKIHKTLKRCFALILLEKVNGMTYKELMTQSLTDLLEPGETLMYPIYGILNQGNAQYYGYFGFTENYLLIALIVGKHVANTIRIPLDIRSVTIKKSPIIKQHVIDISFNEGAPCRIIASPRVVMINLQKDNLPRFVSYLENELPKNQASQLKDISGEKIRRQYFNKFICLVFLVLVMIPLMMTVIGLKGNSLDLSEIAETIMITLWVGGVFLAPFIGVSLLSRFLFGKIVGVVNNEGLFLENDFIPWEDIDEIVYVPDAISIYRLNHSCATVLVNPSGKKEYALDIINFPMYGLRKIKKYRPEIKIKLGKNVLFGILLIGLIPIVVSIVIPLFM